MHRPPTLTLHSVTVAVQTAGEPSLTHPQPTSALAGAPLKIVMPESRPAKMKILRIHAPSFEKRWHRATRVPEFQMCMVLPAPPSAVLNRNAAAWCDRNEVSYDGPLRPL